MEHRKIVKIGGSYYISLPKRWVKAHDLKSSSIVGVEAKRGVLEIYPIGVEDRMEITEVTVDDFVIQRLVTAYLDGVEIINIRSKNGVNPDLIEEIEKTLKLLVGAEIVEESRNRIVVQCFLREDYDISSLVHRIDRITSSMYVDAVKAVLSRDRELAQSVISRDDKVDKLFFLTVRLIRSALKKACAAASEILKLLDYRLVVRNLERIGDYSEAIAKTTIETYPPIPDSFKRLDFFASKIAEVQHEVVKSFVNKDISKAVRCEKLIGELYGELNKLRSKALEERPPLITYLTVDKLIRIAEELEDITSLTTG